MAAPIGALRAEMSAGYAQFARDMGKAKNAVKKNATGMQKAMFQAKRGFDATLKSIKLMGVAAVAGAAIVSRMIKKQIDFADSAQKSAEGVGTTVETLTALKHAADLSGVSFEGLQKGMKAIIKRSADAADGMKEYEEAFDAVGITVTDTEGRLKSAETLILEVADTFSKYEDGAWKSARAMDLFGKSGADMIPLLNEGAAGIKKMTDEARAFGIVVTKEVAEAAERFNDDLGRLGDLFTGVFLSTLPAVLPVLEAYTRNMVDATKETEALGNAGESAAEGLKIMLVSGTLLAATIKTIGQFMGGIAAALVMLDEFEFKKAAFITKETFSDAKNNVQDAIDDIVNIWSALPQKLDGVIKKPLLKAPAIVDPVTGTGVTKATEAEKEKLRLQKEGISTTRALRNETEIYNDEMLRLFKLFNAGHISLETYNRGMDKANEELKKSTEIVEDTGDKFDELTNTINGWARESADAIVEFTTEGKGSFSDMVDSMLKDLLRMAVTKKITEPIFNAFGGFLSGGLGGLGSVFGRATGGSVSSNSLTEVNERRPEIFNLGGRQFLATAGMNGRVIPNTDSLGGGMTINVPVTVAERNPAMQSELRREIEYTVENVIRRNA